MRSISSSVVCGGSRGWAHRWSARSSKSRVRSVAWTAEQQAKRLKRRWRDYPCLCPSAHPTAPRQHRPGDPQNPSTAARTARPSARTPRPQDNTSGATPRPHPTPTGARAPRPAGCHLLRSHLCAQLANPINEQEALHWEPRQCKTGAHPCAPRPAGSWPPPPSLRTYPGGRPAG